MKKTGSVWKIYKLIFLDIWHRYFFNLTIKPQDLDFTLEQRDQYLDSLNLSLQLVDGQGQPVKQLPASPTLYYGNHPSSLDSLFYYFSLFAQQPWIVSFLHNQLHFAFLQRRTIPVGAKFIAQKITPLGLKMKLASRLENLSDQACLKMNRAVPKVVVEKLLKGENVAIFPSGGWGEWQDGIGFALDLLLRTKPDLKLTLQPLKIVSFRELHSVLHGWLHVIGVNVAGLVTIKVGQSMTLAELKTQPFISLTDPKSRAKAIRAWLEKGYQEF